MASGKFSSSVCTAAGTGYYRYIEVVWSSTNNTSDNKSTISWTAYSRSPDASTTSWVYAKNIRVTINGTTTTLIGDTAQPIYKDRALGSGSITVTHGSDGAKSVAVSIAAQIYVYGTDNSTYSGTINMTKNPVYTLSISAGTGSSITVNRTSCAGVGSTGNMSAGAKKLCKGDVLKISASANSNYKLSTLTINNTKFTSGNSYTVNGNVAVVSTAQVLASSVGATNANIGSASTITVTKYNPSYYHSLQYSFGNVSGYIKADGTTSSSEVKFNQTSVAFTVPTTFYAQIPNAKTGTCTITCRTYISSSSSTVLGTARTCTFKANTSSSTCSPIVTGTVIDTNETTKALTGDDSTLIRYKSTAECTISATKRKEAGSITSKLINYATPTNNKRTYSNVSVTSFVFTATDSRGYTSSHTETPTMVAYVNLTCNPVIYRPTPTGSNISMTLSGDLFRGSFGAYNNSLTLRYRYKESGGSYGSWTTISSGITYGSSSYSIATAISLGNSFDYQKEYVFQVNAYDGANGTTLTSVTKTITVQRGIPVFDWGENDLNVNVPLNASGDITVDGNSIYIKYKDITLNSVPLTTQSSGGAYYYNTGYVPTDYNISGDIISLMVTNWSGAAASFVPYYYNNKISFISDISQTVTKIVLRVIYI